MVELMRSVRRTEAVFHLNNRVNVPLNLKENCTPEYARFHEVRPFKLLKIILNCHFVYLAILGIHSLLIGKQLCLFYLYAIAESEIHIC